MTIGSLVVASVVFAGTVKLHVVDAHDNPIANREVWLARTNSTKPLRPFGHQWRLPISYAWWGPTAEDKRVYEGRTDASGNVRIKGVPNGLPMMVVTRFGPRFDSFVRKESSSRPTVDLMKFDGAVYAGSSARVVLAEDREMTGKVTDFDGASVSDVAVTLMDTLYGNMSGYPLTDLDETITDAAGNYRFAKLPNCFFTVTIRPKTPCAVEARTVDGAWKFLFVDSGAGPSGTWGQQVLLKNAQTQCDFRVSRPATITVVVKKGNLHTLGHWYVFIGEVFGFVLADNRSSYITDVLAGTHAVWFLRESDSKRFSAGRISVRPGEKRTFEYTLSEVMRRKERRGK